MTPSLLRAVLFTLIQESGVNQVEALNQLQSEGLISDLVVNLEDIAREDLEKAVDFFGPF